MYDLKIPYRQLTAWLVAAIIPTAIQLTAGASWNSVLLVSVLCLLCVWLRWTLGTEPKGRLMAILQLGLIVIVLGIGTQVSVQSWPRGGHPAVAIMLMALAAWSSWKGTSAAARVGCVLFWFVLALYLVLLGAGAKDVQMQWLCLTKGDVNAYGCVLLLTPAAAAIHLKEKESFKPRLLLIGGFCTLAAGITAGVLSPQVAGSRENAFYEMSRSLNLLGQARRFEAIVSAGMTVGWFLIFSLYLTMSARLTETVLPGKGKNGILGVAVTTSLYLLCDLHIPDIAVLILCAIFWVLVPVITQWIDPIKKSKKSKNSA